MDPELKAKLKDKGTWTRFLFMVLFAVIFNVAEAVLVAVVVLQFLWRLFTGKTLERLDRFGGSLGRYFREMVAYLTFAGDDRPWPFGPWPTDETDDEMKITLPPRSPDAGLDQDY